jgi:membrane fusion protein, multidrug efflux system
MSGGRESDWAATADERVAQGEANGCDPEEAAARPNRSTHYTRGDGSGVDLGRQAAPCDKSIEHNDEDAGSGSAFDPLTGSERKVSDAGESDRAASSDIALQQAHDETDPGADDADEASRRRGSWMPLIELLVAVLLGLVTSDKSTEKTEDSAADQAEADEEARPANQPINDEHDDRPGASKGGDPPATVGNRKSATSERPVEKCAGTGCGEADEDSRPANQPINDERDDRPGTAKSDDPPATVGNDESATSERPVENCAGTGCDEVDEQRRPANQPISDEHDAPPGAGKGGDPPATGGRDMSISSERPGEQRDENASARAGGENRSPDRLISRTPDAVATAGESDRAAILGKPEEKPEVDARPAQRETDVTNDPPDQPIGAEHGAAPNESDRAATSAQPAAQADEDARAREKADEERRQRRRHWLLPIGLLVLALLIAGGMYYWWTTRNLESTDDAFTDGRAITIAPQVAGEVVSLDVDDNQFVKQGQALIHIDPRQYKNSRDQAEGVLATAKAQYAGQQLAAEIAKKNFPALLEQAKAQLESAKASLTKAQADYDRQISLQRPATTQQDVDQAATALWQAQAQVKLAEAQVKQNSPVPQQIGQSEAQVRQLKGQLEQGQAQLNQAELNLSWTIVTAPQDGWVTRRNVEKGNYVIAGQQIMSIVTPAVWVTANFKETQLTYMRPGQPARIRIDAYPSLDVRGHVDSIQHGSGSKFTAFPPENATGNFVKIVQRVPVKIIIDSGLPPNVTIPLGISVEPTVTVR